MIGGGGPNNPALSVQSSGISASFPNTGSAEIEQVGYTHDLTFPQSPFLEGFIDFRTGDISATITFEADGLGGWRTRVSGTKGGEGFEFVIP